MQKQVILLSAACAVTAFAGVSNPDLSLIGQVRSDWTNDPQSVDQYRPTLGLGEVELVAQSALNPYSDGTFVLAIGEEGLEVEEAFLDLNRALPGGLALKAGKFRAPFGKLNAVHPHAYPFIGVPHLLDPESGVLPGEESYNDVALELSELFPGVGSWAPQISVALQQGGLFRASQDTLESGEDYDPSSGETHLSAMVHTSNGFELGESAAGDLGFSWAQGTNNVAAHSKTTLYGADLKLKFQLAPETRLVLQGEGIWRHEQVSTWDAAADRYREADGDRQGFLTFADLTRGRWNLGGLYEQSTAADALNDGGGTAVVERSLRGFTGFSLMEETTLFRLAVERRWLTHEEPVNTASVQILYSMGPHKPHQF
jgi:hypothetical protein